MRAHAGVIIVFLALTACASDDVTAPRTDPSLGVKTGNFLADTVRVLAAGRGVTVLPAPPSVRPPLVVLGQALAFDKELSGNRDISCMSCHLEAFGTGDQRSLSIGQGATGLGPGRQHPEGLFIPRNAPPLFNLHTLTSLFWDGRVSGDAKAGFHTPAGAELTPEMTRVLEFGPISALPLFPVLSREEMRGFTGNELAAIPDQEMRQTWTALMVRLGRIPEYRRMFQAAYPGVRFADMTFAHASNAIAGFILDRLFANQSPWDRFLAGQDNALTAAQLVGAKDFMSLRCSICHNGPALTDNQFHNVAVAQFGPGKGNGPGLNDDFGRENTTGEATMRYAFRTPALRNVVLTAPYGHDGAIFSLRDFIAHYSESHLKLRAFDRMTLEPLLQNSLVANAEQILLTRDPIIDGVVIPDSLIDHLTTFMDALTDEPRRFRSIVPTRVPSGLPIDVP